MTLVQALLAAVTAETACIIFLFGILLAKNKKQDAELEKCVDDRKALHKKYEDQQKAFSDLYRELWQAGAVRTKEPSA